MRSSVRVWAVLTVAMWMCAIPASATKQEAVEGQALPKPREVIDRYIEAIGGEAALREIESFEMTGTFKMPAAGVSGTLNIYAMAPDRQLAVIDIEGLGQIREGFDGNVAWAMDPTMGPRLKEGAELAQTRFLADFYSVLHEESRYRTMETVAREEFDGKPCYKLRLVTKNGIEMLEYYDVESGLQVGSSSTTESPMGQIRTTQTLGDYKRFGPLRFPTEIRISFGAMSQALSISDIEFDAVERSRFDLPAEIRALVTE